MNIHEYQAKRIFDEYNIPTPVGRIAYTLNEVYNITKYIGKKVVIKAQVHTGGRGKSGGVKLANNAEEAENIAKDILGMNIKGFTVEKVLVVEQLNIDKEFYLGMVIDRDTLSITVMFSEEGGVDIEETAEKSPEKIKYAHIDPYIGYKTYHSRYLFSNIIRDLEQFKEMHNIALKLYNIFIEKDCSLVEINPLVILKDGKITAADSKMTFDDNSLFRQKEIYSMKELSEKERNEEEARRNGLSFVELDGDIGCMVNGAGLAMATMDIIKLYNGNPANFLDVGGSSNPDKVVTGLKIILSNKNIKSILINIFGGITRCDDIAIGILKALERIKINIPLIVRLTGTASDIALNMLKGKPSIIPVESMEEAVKLVIEKSYKNSKGGKE